MTLALFREDTNKQREGSPIHYEGMTFYLRRRGIKESTLIINKLERELYSPFYKKNEDDFNLLSAYWLAEYGVANWEGVYTENGDELPYSKENAQKVFLNSEFFLSLNPFLISCASNFENYLYDAIDDEVDALKKP